MPVTCGILARNRRVADQDSPPPGIRAEPTVVREAGTGSETVWEMGSEPEMEPAFRVEAIVIELLVLPVCMPIGRMASLIPATGRLDRESVLVAQDLDPVRAARRIERKEPDGHSNVTV